MCYKCENMLKHIIAKKINSKFCMAIKSKQFTYYSKPLFENCHSMGI